MAISSSAVSSSPVSAAADNTGNAILIVATAMISATLTTNEEILTRTERHILTFTAELMPWVLTR